MHADDAQPTPATAASDACHVMHAEATGDLAISRLAARQHGVVSRAQLTAAGLGRGSIAHRLTEGRLHRIHRGVYLVGHAAPAPLAREIAAVLACGEGAVLSHRAAGALWGLIAAAIGDVDVTVPGRNPGRRPGIRVHRPRRLDRRDVRRRYEIPVTTPARTLLDLAAVLSGREIERAVNEAQIRRLTHREELVAVVGRSSGRNGAVTLRAVLAEGARPAPTRSEAEDRLLALLRAAELPPTDVNARVGRHEVDLLWRRHRLIVEVDGYAYHAGRAAFERDRLRDAELQAAGYRVMRVTWRQLVYEPEALIARVAQALAR